MTFITSIGQARACLAGLHTRTAVARLHVPLVS